ncbi:MAG: glycine cleavage system protein GcvH [Bacillati bacterium ANGP1]|uniref:Glycine cleavage system H protein n=1 Tax=Candidatus Segetimicrobium genomatis TaxID=2569760 RepID=A0A537K3B0_9BACT|nr:MAG: glycine cleavage system protein GcvH [Terrabacteria group bacterium ANGP1]
MTGGVVYPKDLRYSKEHEWAKVEGRRVRVGITPFAADRLSDVVYVELPKVGADVAFMQPFGVVESVKAVSDLYSPVSGKVSEVNEALRDRPEIINTDPYGAWMIVVEPRDVGELKQLMDADAYLALIGEQRS